LLNLDEAYNYDGIEADIEKIDRVVDVVQIKGLPGVCAGYQNSNALRNYNRLSETMSTKDDQSKYIGAFLNIISHNTGLFLKERLDLFVETNYLRDLIQIDFGKELYDTVDRAYTYYWTFEDYLVQAEYGPERMKTGVWYEAVTQTAPGLEMLYAIFPYLFPLLGIFVAAAIKRARQLFWMLLAAILREGIIFLTSPDAMIVYYMPDITFCVFLCILLAVVGITRTGAIFAPSPAHSGRRLLRTPFHRRASGHSQQEEL
jgi:hypothetical protein